MPYLKNKTGFTLIELLVVISIISLLSSVAFSSLTSARSKARDSKRVQSMIQIRNALELYRTSTTSLYPGTIGVGVMSSAAALVNPNFLNEMSGTTNGLGNLIPGTIASLPDQSSATYYYAYINSPQSSSNAVLRNYQCCTNTTPLNYILIFTTENQFPGLQSLYYNGINLNLTTGKYYCLSN